MIRAVLRVITALIFLPAAFGVGQQATVTVDEAKQLVGLVLRHQKFPASSPYCQIGSLDKQGKPFARDYYAFGASCDFPNTAATSPWGTFLVSPRTGDVLNFNTCKWLRYADLGERQKQIMLKTGATEASEGQYRETTGCTKSKGEGS